MKDSKLLGMCLVISAAMLSAAILYHAQTRRYEVKTIGSMCLTIDTRTGEARSGYKEGDSIIQPEKKPQR
jgi:hypothetical protein